MIWFVLVIWWNSHHIEIGYLRVSCFSPGFWKCLPSNAGATAGTGWWCARSTHIISSRCWEQGSVQCTGVMDDYDFNCWLDWHLPPGSPELSVSVSRLYIYVIRGVYQQTSFTVTATVQNRLKTRLLNQQGSQQQQNTQFRKPISNHMSNILNNYTIIC